MTLICTQPFSNFSITEHKKTNIMYKNSMLQYIKYNKNYILLQTLWLHLHC